MGNEDQIPAALIELMTTANPITFSWLADLYKLVEQFDHHDEIHIDRFETFPSVGEFVRETLGDGLPFEIPDQIMSFYNVIDGFELKWSHMGEPAGHIRMCGFGEVFGSWIDKLWGVVPDSQKDDEDEVDFSWEIRGIDDGGDHDFLTVMHTPENLPSFSLYFRNPIGATYRLDVDFPKYLELLLITRGVTGWQYLVSDVDYNEDAEALEHALKATAQIQKLFPKALSAYAFKLPEGATE